MKAASVTSVSETNLVISDDWRISPRTIQALGNWSVSPLSTVDVTGTVTTLPSGARAIRASQILVYTDSSGKPLKFPIPMRDGKGRLIEWSYKHPAKTK